MKPQIVLPIGLPASGKTQFSKAWLAEDPDSRVRVNYDELRVGIFGESWVWNRRDEEAMKAQARSIVKKALMAGLSVVVDNTNLSRGVRASWQDLGRDLGAEYVEHELDTPIDVCIARDRARGKSRVGQAVIDGMAVRYGLLDWAEAPRPELWSAKLPPIAIVDIDGTVANDNSRLRHLTPTVAHKMDCTASRGGKVMYRVPDGMCVECLSKPRKNWQAYFAEVANDVPIAGMVNMLGLLERDHMIIFLSGRPVQDGRTQVGIITEDWLLRSGLTIDRLFLKTANFHQLSPDFKREMLEYIPKDRVSYVFEDDPRCVEMYRKELPGAMVAQVADRSR